MLTAGPVNDATSEPVGVWPAGTSAIRQTRPAAWNSDTLDAKLVPFSGIFVATRTELALLFQ